MDEIKIVDGNVIIENKIPIQEFIDAKQNEINGLEADKFAAENQVELINTQLTLAQAQLAQAQQ